MKVTATKNNILVEEVARNDTFVLPTEKNDGLRMGKVISVGDFVWHICHEKVYSPAKEGDIIYFVYNGNEKINIDGKICYLIIFDQVRAIIEE